MKRASARAALMGLALAASAILLPASAQAGSPPTRALAQAVGVGETELREFLVVGPLTYRQLRQDSSRTSARLLRALGPQRHARLLAGEPIQVQVQIDGQPVQLQVQRGR